MDAETLAKVFRAFYTTKQGGSGLGLPTARKIVEAHGGTIDIESAPGRGTKVTIWLPAPPRLPTAGAARHAAASPGQLDGPPPAASYHRRHGPVPQTASRRPRPASGRRGPQGLVPRARRRQRHRPCPHDGRGAGPAGLRSARWSGSGTEGAAASSRSAFDIVVTDLMMNDIGGLRDPRPGEAGLAPRRR